jgi:hypothetical protein
MSMRVSVILMSLSAIPECLTQDVVLSFFCAFSAVLVFLRTLCMESLVW